jgi:hypothetical protein
MKARFANNVSQLCIATGFSRTEFYRLRRMAGAPVPRSDGSHSISRWRAFAKKARASAKPTEKESLEIRCLRLRAERMEHEIGEREKVIRQEVIAELLPLFSLGPMLLRSALDQARNELSPKFEGLKARAIWSAWRDRERQAFNFVYGQLRKKFNLPLVEPPENLIPFEERKAVSQ